MSIVENGKELIAHRYLLLLWLKYRIQARYRQTILGILWIVLLPVSTSLVIAFAFSQLLGARTTVGVPFVAFLLSGMVLFSIFRSIIQNGQVAMLRMMRLIKQIYFPREIIIILLVGEALIDFFFMFITMIGINAIFFEIYPNLLYVFLPVLILIVTGLSMGLALALSWVSLAIRDMQQLVAVMLQLLFYITVLFSPERASSDYAWLIALNPLSAIVIAFRDIILYERMPDWGTLYFPAILSMVLLYLGYIFFKSNEDRLVDMA